MHTLSRWLRKQFSLFIGSVGMCYGFINTPNTYVVAA
jgi:hypothetical protein